MEQKTGAHASTLEMELMHEAEKQGAMHHFSSEHGPALIRAGGTNWEIDAGTLKNDVPASIIFRRRANKRADVRRQ